MIGPKIRAEVRSRAHNTCEYCHLHQDDSPLALLHVEHIIPKMHGGSDDLDNLALACIDCNLHKGPNLTGIDPETNKITALFHPRREVWDDHFEWLNSTGPARKPEITNIFYEVLQFFPIRSWPLRQKRKALPIYYVASPQAMVAAMRKTLNEAGVDDDNIRT